MLFMAAVKGRIEVLVTDGQQIRRLLWLERKPNGMYLGWCSKGEYFHVTYHEDGNMFWKIEGKAQPIKQGPRLSELKGLYPLSNMGVAEIKELPLLEYKLRQVDSVVYIDSRTYPKGFNLDVFLVEPERLDYLNPLFQQFWKRAQWHIFTSVEPWVVVAYKKME